jgi:hypothetical protein
MLVKVRWGEFKRITREIAEKSEIEALPAMDSFLAGIIVDVCGLTDDADQPVAWTPAVLDDLTPGTIVAMFKACVSIGEAGSGDPLPATVAAESSVSSPAG